MIPFAKYSGAGNDFVLVEDDGSVRDPRALARRICPRATGVGVDGMALLRRLEDGDLHVRFFNPDGSEFATCGNGSRCVARYAVDRGLAGDGDLRIVTDAGTVGAEVDEEGVTLLYRIEAWVERRVEVPYGEGRAAGWLVQMGTPHLVLPVERLPEGEIDTLARPIRHHDALGEEGANVNFVALASPGAGRIRTFERGVETETLACGAGAMSATLALHAAGVAEPELELSTRSGEVLVVSLPDADASGAPDRGSRSRIRLRGPARRVFEGRFPREGE